MIEIVSKTRLKKHYISESDDPNHHYMTWKQNRNTFCDTEFVYPFVTHFTSKLLIWFLGILTSFSRIPFSNEIVYYTAFENYNSLFIVQEYQIITCRRIFFVYLSSLHSLFEEYFYEYHKLINQQFFMVYDANE